MKKLILLVAVFLVLSSCSATDADVIGKSLHSTSYTVESFSENVLLTHTESVTALLTDPAQVPAELLTEPTETQTEPYTEKVTQIPPHSEFYIESLTLEEVTEYFTEVSLDAEYVFDGDATSLQKWTEPVLYYVYGSPTAEDIEVLNDFCEWLNSIYGFPGIHETDNPDTANLDLHFCGYDEMIDIMGETYRGNDGCVRIWFDNNDEIYEAVICCSSEIDQEIRNSVIIEEIYNGLGPIQDTSLRSDSIIYAGYSYPQNLTQVDELILKLLYHPSLECGMNADECAEAISQLYY